MVKIFFFTILILQVLIQVYPQKTLLPIKNRNITTISNILSQYSDYDFIIHYDNATIQTSNFIEDLHNSPQARLLLNYDMKNFYDRPVGYKFVHIIFLANSFQFGRFSKVLFNLEFNDVILILSQDNIDNGNVEVLNFWQQEGLDRAGSVFVLNPQTGDLHHECFYCGPMSGVLKKISVKEIMLRDFINDFSDFHGQHFKIGYMDYMPFFWCEESSDGYNVNGPEGKLLELLSTALNFQYSLENFEGFFDEEWRAMVDAIHHRKLDWAVGGISASTERAELVDLTKDINTEMYTVLFCCCSSDSNWRQSWKQVLLPFQLWLWLCICSLLLVMTFLLKKAADYFADNSSTSVLKHFEITLRGLVEQPLSRIPAKCLVKRFLLISWWYFAIIIATAYRSKLAASLIHPYYKQPTSIQELLQEDYSFQVNSEDWSVLKENLEMSPDATSAEVLRRSNNNLNVCSSIQRAVEKKVAIIDEGTNLQYEAITYCRGLLSSKDFSHLRLIGQEVFPSHHVWPLQLAAPYRRKFSMVIENLFATGILRHWYNLASKKQLPLSNHNEIESVATPVPLTTMFAPILMLAVGALLATIVFVCEVAYFTLNYLMMFYKEHKCAVDTNK